MNRATEVGRNHVDDFDGIELAEPALGDGFDALEGTEDVARDAAGGVGVARVDGFATARNALI